MPLSRTDHILRYFRAIETDDLVALQSLLAPDIEQIEWPNQIKLKGDRRNLTQLSADFERGRGLLRTQSYEIISLTDTPDRTIAEVLWRGVLAVPLGALKPGDEMQAHSAIVFAFTDGLISSQRNYDCFEPFTT